MEVGSVAFRSIGFHTSLILNRLRNEGQISEDKAADDHKRREQQKEEEAVRAKLTFVKMRLAELAAFERRARGGK